MSSEASVPRRAVLVVNAHSRRGRELYREAARKLEAARIALIESHALRDPRELAPRVKAAVKGGAPMVIVGGGDGSLSAAVDELVDQDCVFALLPFGTANSFARTLGIPIDLDGAIEVIATGRRRRIDLGVINGDYFANCAAMGLAPMIGEGIPPGLKRRLGRIGYFAWAVWCLIRFHPFRLTVDDGAGRRTLWAVEVRIANGGFHGGVELVERADVASGEMVVQAVAGRSSLPLIWDWFAKYWKLPARHAATEEFHARRLHIEPGRASASRSTARWWRARPRPSRWPSGRSRSSFRPFEGQPEGFSLPPGSAVACASSIASVSSIGPTSIRALRQPPWR